MDEKSGLKIIGNLKWQEFLTRPYSQFFLSLHAQVYLKELGGIIGADFNNFLYLSIDGLVKIYRLDSEVNLVEEKIKDILLNPSLLKNILKEIDEAKQKSVITRVNSLVVDATCKDFFESCQMFRYLFVRLTTITYHLGQVLEMVYKPTDPEYNLVLNSLKEYRSKDYAQEYYDKMIYPWLSALSSNFGVSISCLESMTLLEIKDVIEGKTDINVQNLKKRKNKYIFLCSEGQQFTFASDDFLRRAISFLDIKDSMNCTNSVNGQVAFSGKVNGIVRVLKTVEDIGKIDYGEILVAVSTNPVLLPAIKRCIAIVTDEGGIISHAAILAREMEKPCIIGTKIATQIFKDGDMVEVDADKGVVRRIK